MEKEYDESLKSPLDSLLKKRNYFLISANSVLRAVCQLKVNKALGVDSASGDQLRNGSPILLQERQLLFQICIDSAPVPKSFCSGSRYKDPEEMKNVNECGG